MRRGARSPSQKVPHLECVTVALMQLVHSLLKSRLVGAARPLDHPNGGPDDRCQGAGARQGTGAAVETSARDAGDAKLSKAQHQLLQRVRGGGGGG